MKKPKIGSPAPDFNCMNEHEQPVKLSDFRGKKLVLYFYPQDNTPTCTTEACNLRDNYHRFLAQGYEILGVSPDSPKKHRNFIQKFNLPFSLLADTDHQICKAYGAWGKKILFGLRYKGVLRSTFVIDENGIITDIIDKVKSKEHSDQIL